MAYAIGGRRDEWDVNVNVDTTGTRESDGLDAPGRREGARRIVITIFLLITLAAVLVQNMPTSVTKAGLIVAAQPYLNLTGLDQGWSIFSPNPRQQSVFVLARIDRADGSVELRPIPTGIGLSAYGATGGRSTESLWPARPRAARSGGPTPSGSSNRTGRRGASPSG